MANAYINGLPVGGSTNYASAITCVDKNGEQSTVQAEVDKLWEETSELNKKSVVIDDYELLSGMKILIYNSGNTCTLRLYSNVTEAVSAGQKDVYYMLPEKYRPLKTIMHICFSQTGKKILLNIKSTGEVGIYYVLDAISQGDNVYGLATWGIG